jgi:hypothetical protein
MRDFECHITVDTHKVNAPILESIGESLGWKTSFIEGDPDLGKGSRFFFTKHYNALDLAYNGTERLNNALGDAMIIVARKKIEEVLLDTRAGNWERP